MERMNFKPYTNMLSLLLIAYLTIELMFVQFPSVEVLKGQYLLDSRLIFYSFLLIIFFQVVIYLFIQLKNTIPKESKIKTIIYLLIGFLVINFFTQSFIQNHSIPKHLYIPDVKENYQLRYCIGFVLSAIITLSLCKIFIQKWMHSTIMSSAKTTNWRLVFTLLSFILLYVCSIILIIISKNHFHIYDEYFISIDVFHGVLIHTLTIELIYFLLKLEVENSDFKVLKKMVIMPILFCLFTFMNFYFIPFLECLPSFDFTNYQSAGLFFKSGGWASISVFVGFCSSIVIFGTLSLAIKFVKKIATKQSSLS